MGGLGNQLFQYAAGRTLAERHKTELKLDIGWFSTTEQQRGYALDNFHINASIAKEEEIDALTRRGKTLAGKAVRRLMTKTGIWEDRWIRERYYHFDPSVLDLPDNVYLHGYWQSYKYFADIDAILRKELIQRKPLGKAAVITAEKAACLNSFSLHVRRGDYCSEAKVSERFFVCGPDYFMRACEIVSQRVSDPVFFIFSDDPGWVKENLKLPYQTVIVEGNTALEDLVLISRCRHTSWPTVPSASGGHGSTRIRIKSSSRQRSGLRMHRGIQATKCLTHG
jgi:hypothetical protein